MPPRTIKFLLLAVLAALAAAASAQAARPFEVAFQDDDVLVKGYWSGPDAVWSDAKLVRASWVRMQLQWGDTLSPAQAKAKKRPRTLRYRWTDYDRAIAGAKANKIHVQLALTGPAPAWATGNKRYDATHSYRPSAKAYGQWVTAAVKHFRRLGIRRYSVWNEPNHVGYLSPLKETPKLYRALWASGSKAIRKADPRRGTQILFAETAPWQKPGQSLAPLAFLRSVLCVNSTYTRRSRARGCPKVVADGYAQHPYDAFYSPTKRRPGADNVTISTLDRLTKALDKLSRIGALRRRGGGKLPVYLTEFGYFARRLNKRTRAYPEKTRRRYLTQSFDIALKNPRVRQLVWYQLIEPPDDQRSWLSYVLTTNNGPLPTFESWVAWSKRNRAKLAH
jgi:hypothetical protein